MLIAKGAGRFRGVTIVPIELNEDGNDVFADGIVPVGTLANVELAAGRTFGIAKTDRANFDIKRGEFRVLGEVENA